MNQSEHAPALKFARIDRAGFFAMFVLSFGLDAKIVRRSLDLDFLWIDSWYRHAQHDCVVLFAHFNRGFPHEFLLGSEPIVEIKAGFAPSILKNLEGAARDYLVQSFDFIHRRLRLPNGYAFSS